MNQYMISITIAIQVLLVNSMLPFETTDMPEDDEEDIDPFAELEIGTSTPSARKVDPLAAFEEDDDPLSAFTDDDEPEFEDIVISFDDDEAPAIEQTPVGNSAEATYKLLLETVWIDDILDPSEVELLARKRGELGLSFERHLQLVRGIIGG